MSRLFIAFAAAAMALVPGLSRADTKFYLVDAVAQQSGEAQTRAQARVLEAIDDDMARRAGVEAKLIYSTDPDINAFASEVGADRIVVVQEGLLETTNGDRDAVVAALGHELAHHKAAHIRAGKRQQEGVRLLGAIPGAVVGAKAGTPQRRAGAAGRDRRHGPRR